MESAAFVLIPDDGSEFSGPPSGVNTKVCTFGVQGNNGEEKGAFGLSQGGAWSASPWLKPKVSFFYTRGNETIENATFPEKY